MGTGIARRRRKRRKSSMAGDAFELFLDAITNTMGVVMFIMLMVVIFGRSPVEEDLPDPSVTKELQALREERNELQRKVAALPPAGDPALLARWNTASKLVAEDRKKLDEMQRQVVVRMQDLASRTSELQASEQALAALRAQLEKVNAENSAPASAFVRISRFRTDGRPSAVLTLNGGKVSRKIVTHQTKSISPPVEGEAVTDAATARDALTALLADAPPATHRVELIVWEDSFPQAKLIEQALVEMGYDTNPLPVVAGQVIKSGTGGVQ